MFKIGDFAKLNRVTVSALRHYDAIGLLRPETTDNFTGYRYYSVSQMPKLNGKKGVKTVPPCMVIYYDPGYKEDKVDAEIIEPIMGDLEGNDRIKVRNLESG